MSEKQPNEESDKLEFEIQKQKITSRYNLAVTFLGTFLVAVVGSYLTFAEKTEKNQQDFDGGHRDFVAKFVDIAIDDNIERRQRLARYFAYVTLDETQKLRWEQYSEYVENLINQNPIEIAKLKKDLQSASAAERSALETRIKFLEQQLGSNRANVRTSNSENCNRTHKTFPDRWFCIATAEEQLGVQEIPGPEANQRILDYAEYTSLTKIYTDDDIPWVGLFAAWVVGQSGAGKNVPEGPARSANWVNFGEETNNPKPGDIAVTKPRRPGGGSGFVGFFIKRIGDNGESVELLGGNVRNAVGRVTVKASRIRTYRTLASSDGTEEVRNLE